MDYDYNFLAENDNYTCQHTSNKIAEMTAGKMLGGTSALMHLAYLRGNPLDFSRWAEVAGDESWNYDNLLPYFIKMERLEVSEILNSDTGNLHGTKGPLGLTRQKSDTNDNYIKSMEEIGFKYNLDVNSNETLGITDPVLLMLDGSRQDTSECYIRPAKNRKNLNVFKNTLVTKILFDDNKNAIGVEALTSKNKTATIKAKKEVIVSAGAVKSPQLLLLSGIGPQQHLEDFNISVVSDLPVGQTLRERVSVALAFKMQASKKLSLPPNPSKYPVPITVGLKALNKSQTVADYQVINLIFPHDSLGLTIESAFVLKYENAITNKLIKANTGHEVLLAILGNGHPESTGELKLKSTNPLDQPEIHLGLFSKSSDVEDMGNYLKDYANIGETSFFKDIGAELVEMDLPECKDLEYGSLDYWKCYAVSMSLPFWQTMSTCSMGSVVDSHLKVKGVQNLRVVDASVLPYFTCGIPAPAVIVVAEKAADLIKQNQ